MKKTLAVLAVGTMLPLCAQEGIRLGAQLSASTTMTKIHKKEAKRGLGLGGFAIYDICSGQSVVAKLDMNRFSKVKGFEAGRDFNVNTVGLGVDYIMHLNKSQTGPYGLAGLDIQHKLVKEKVLYDGPIEKYKYNKPGYTVGAGYDIDKNLGVQVRYNIHAYKDGAAVAKNEIAADKDKIKVKNHSYPAVIVGVTYTF